MQKNTSNNEVDMANATGPRLDHDSERISEPGWYWYCTEYPDEGSCGPFETEDAALADAAAIEQNPEFTGTFRWPGGLGGKR